MNRSVSGTWGPAIIAIAAVVLVGNGCVTSSAINQRAESVDRLLADQWAPMYTCTPELMARAEANAAFARHEAFRGRPHDAKKFIEGAETALKEAYENSRGKECLDDRDADLIPDDLDRCPDIKEDIDQFSDEDGCPDPDNDGDGILDVADQCPIEAGPTTNRGCPVFDRDNDGLMDPDDRCPDQFGPRDNGGCPYGDRDADGLKDPDDRCPDEAGPRDNGGCPYKRIEVTKEKIELHEKIFFNFGKATINERSYPLLDEIAGVLKNNPNMKIRIEGHTDSKGSNVSNKRLSQARADEVRKYMMSRGLDHNRMESIGYGEERPIDSNDSEAGMAVNRRVEFLILSN